MLGPRFLYVNYHIRPNFRGLLFQTFHGNNFRRSTVLSIRCSKILQAKFRGLLKSAKIMCLENLDIYSTSPYIYEYVIAAVCVHVCLCVCLCACMCWSCTVYVEFFLHFFQFDEVQKPFIIMWNFSSGIKFYCQR